jgi:hypothetical protein
MWAGLIAEMDAIRGSSLGFVTPRLYAVAASEEGGGSVQAFSEVTAGGNCLHSAQAGWNLVTGWGTPNALLLYAALTSTFVTLTVSPSPTSVFPGASTTVTIDVKNATSDQPIMGVPVTLAFSASAGYTGPCGGSFGNATVITNANGSGAAKLSVPYCYFGGQAEVSVMLLSDGLFGEASASVTVSLLAGNGFVTLLTTYPVNLFFFSFIIVIAVVVGFLATQRTKRRRGRPPVAQYSAGAPPGASQGWVNPPPSTPSPPSGPPSVSPTYAPSTPWISPTVPSRTGPVATSASTPAAVAVAPPVSPAPPPPIPLAVRCPRCGTVIPAFSLTCPKCGLARP